MGNIRQLAPGEVAPSGLPDVHGVAHRLKPADVAKLTDMEHEYRWAEQLLVSVSATVCVSLVPVRYLSRGSPTLHVHGFLPGHIYRQSALLISACTAQAAGGGCRAEFRCGSQPNQSCSVRVPGLALY